MQPRVLLIEDNPDDVLLIKRAFRQVHPTVPLDVLSNGEEAIQYLNGSGKFADRKKYPLPNLVVLDLKIPRKSGLEVLSWLWDQADLKRLRVIVLTNSQCGQDIKKAFDLAVESYFVKPSSFDDLLELVRKIEFRLFQTARKPRRETRSQFAAL